MTSVTGTTASTATSSSSSSSLTGSQNIQQTYDQFLKLLTTQLKNQDPLNPTDTAQFTQQLIGFSEVEQQISSNSKLDKLVTASQMNQALAAAAYIDKSVEIQTNNLELQSSKATAVYTLNEQATGAVQLKVTDTSGKVINTYSVSNTMGRHTFDWNGKDSSGNVVPDGTYAFTVVAKDKSGNQLTVDQSMIAKVTGLQLTDQANLLSFGDLNLELSKVMSIVKS